MFKDAGFYIIWSVFSLFPLTIAVLAPDKIRSKIIAILCVLAVTFGVTVLMYQDAENAHDRWNNGVCSCGGTYELSAASGRGSFKSFYYSCNTCGHTEEFDHLMK
mgnify:FL=1